MVNSLKPPTTSAPTPIDQLAFVAIWFIRSKLVVETGILKFSSTTPGYLVAAIMNRFATVRRHAIYPATAGTGELARNLKEKQ